MDPEDYWNRLMRRRELLDSVLGWDNTRWAVVRFSDNKWFAAHPVNDLRNPDFTFPTFEQAIAYADERARR